MQLNVLEYLEEGALKHSPDRIAVIDNAREYTFRELEQRAKSCACQIMQTADQIGRPIAVFLPKGAGTIIANLGILYSGHCYTNLDSKSPVQRLEKLLANIDPVLIITDASMAAALLAIGIDKQKLIFIDEILTSAPHHDAEQLTARRHAVIDTDPVCIINTSGSTGTPKSVVMHHRSIIDFIDWCLARFEFSSSDIIGSLSPFYFDIYSLELYVSLARGCTIAIIPEHLAAFPAKLAQFLEDQQTTFLFWVPTIMVTMANMNLLENRNLSCLRRIFFAGEVFPTKHLNYWREKLVNTEFVNLYGPIEITVDCTYFVVDRDFSDDESIPIGLPCRNSDILIIKENDTLATGNEQGELCVRGSSLALGYYNNPEQTARAFTQNPLNPHYPERIYRTGDLVYKNEHGEIMFAGRKDYQIKHLGYRIELAETESAALAITEIKNGCVLYNAPKKEITLFFESDTDLSPAQIRTKLLARLPKYMLPTAFHQLGALPMNPNGKIDRKKLADLYFGE